MATDQQGAEGATQDQAALDAAKAAAADQAAQQQEQQDNAGDAAKDTTTSGDAKGETQTIAKEDVGSVTDALGLGLASDAATAAIAGAQGNTGTPGVQGVEQAAQTPAPTPTPVVKPAAVTAQVRKTVQVPQNSNAGARDASTQPTAAAQTAGTVKPAATTGAVVKNTAATAVADDRQLPEVVAAMKVAKPQTQSALYQVIDYADRLNPGKRVDTKTIEQAQVNLRVALFTILSAEDVNFKVVYQALLAIVRKHKNNCFAITARNRGLNTITLQAMDNKNMRFLTKIVDLLVLTAGTTSVEDVKRHYDFSKLADWCPNQRIQQNLTSYYA
uniref:Uncharacterized protein n=1 Tax=Burkholderia phage vB_BgluM-SURPRISE13 TaxID=3159457 RepID=A0AAU7PF59_9VIRU